MGRRAHRKTNNLALLAMVVAAAAFGIGYYIQQQLRPYRIFYAFTAEERGWRDQAFEVALYSGLAAAGLLCMARLVRKL